MNYLLTINIFRNIIKKNNFLVIFKKIIKRFEKNTSIEAKKIGINFIQ